MLAPFLIALLAVAAPASHRHSAQPATTQAPAKALNADAPDLDRAAFAAGVQDALLSSGYLRVVASITQGDERYFIRSDMSADRLRVEVYRDDTLIAAYAVREGRVQEYSPEHVPAPDDFEYRHLVLEYDVLDVVEGEVAVGSGMVFETRIDYMIAALAESWLDPRTERVSWWRDRVLKDERLPDQDVGSLRCAVFRDSVTIALAPTETSEADELTVTHTTYFDRATWLPVRWETTKRTSTSETTQRRDFQFTRAAKAPEDLAWSLDVRQLRSAVPPDAPEHAGP